MTVDILLYVCHQQTAGAVGHMTAAGSLYQDAKQWAQNRSLGYTSKDRDPEGPRGASDNTISAISEDSI